MDRGSRFLRDGAAILDIGGESTRPGSEPVPAAVELTRVRPAIEALVAAGLAPISVDTSKPEVAEVALRAGAVMLNDVSGLRDPELAAVAARHGASLVVMHNGWNLPPRSPGDDLLDDVARQLARLVDLAVRAGVPPERIVVDPGIGFGKDANENLRLMRELGRLRARLTPCAMLVGPSRKRFIGEVLDAPPDRRLEGTLACVALAVAAGVELIRVHDVQEAVRAARMAAAVARGAP